MKKEEAFKHASNGIYVRHNSMLENNGICAGDNGEKIFFNGKEKVKFNSTLREYDHIFYDDGWEFLVPIKEIFQENKNTSFTKPAYYNKFSVELTDMMIAIWGKQAVINHYEIHAFKCRMLAGSEDSKNSLETDIGGSDWCLKIANELRDKQ